MRIALIAIPLALAGCSDLQLSSTTEAHRSWVCSHQQVMTALAEAAIKNAGSIKDENLRAAAVARARADLEIVGECKSTAGGSPTL